MIPRRLAAAGLLVWALATAPAEARAETPPPGTVDYAVPDAAAFTYLGTTPTKISQPGSIRDLAIDLANGVQDGSVAQGLALSVRPWFLVPGLDIPLVRYRQSPLYYMLANTQLSAGTVQTSGDAGSTDIAVGARVTIIDQGDQMLSQTYVDEMAAGMKRCAPSMPGASTSEQRLLCYAANTKTLREQWLTDHWNATRVTVAGATGWRAPGSVLADTSWLGAAAWLVGGTGFGTSWLHLLLQLRYDYRRPERTHDLQYGGRALVGSGRLNGFAEVIGTQRWNAPAGVDAGTGSWTGGVEVRVADHLWIATGFGSGFSTEGADRVIVIANLRWAVSNEARFDPRPAP